MNEKTKDTINFISGLIILTIGSYLVGYWGNIFIASDLHIGHIGNYKDGTDTFFLIFACLLTVMFGLGVMMSGMPRMEIDKELRR